MINAFPKIFTVGTDYIVDILKEEVEVSEKLDGSSFAIGKVKGEVFMRSKGAQLYTENPEKMFVQAIAYAETIEHLLPEGLIFYIEYLSKPKHNTLEYDRVPKNNLMLYAVMDVTHKFHPDLEAYAELLDIECVPILYRGLLKDASELDKMIDAESVLGGCKMEGVVVKNYVRKFLLGGQPMPLMAGKLVSEAFKEVHRDRWGKEEKGKSRMDTFFDSFRTESRWEKAVQHLKEDGVLENAPKDIGSLMKEIHKDIEEEEKEAIKEFLWREFHKELKRKAIRGMPEWYRNKLQNGDIL